MFNVAFQILLIVSICVSHLISHTADNMTKYEGTRKGAIQLKQTRNLEHCLTKNTILAETIFTKEFDQ